MSSGDAPAADREAIDPIAPLVEIARRLQERCVAAGLLVAAAESCTGGLLTHILTEVPGSSAYLLGGVVSYADRAKVDLLGVDPDHLAAHGAVSAQVARAMAQGARERFGADLGVAITGVAGPDGGSDAKPVGLTYVAVADEDGVEVRRLLWTGDRSANKRDSTGAALDLLFVRADALVEARTGARAGARAGARTGAGSGAETGAADAPAGASRSGRE
jgi:nicotinamide-nucleotide amidase